MTTALVPTEPAAVATTEVTPPGEDLLASPHAFRNALEMAQVLSRSQLIPQHFRGKPEDVLAGIMLARTMGENVFTVLQNVHFVGGKPGWAAPFLIARANASGIFEGELAFDTSGQGADLAVTCSAVLRKSGKTVSVTVSLAMAKADGWTKNAKYSSLPEQMLCYRSATFLIRRYAPGILLGYRPTDELEDIAATKGERVEYTDPEPASSPPRVSRAASQPSLGRGEPVSSAGSSASSPGPGEGVPPGEDVPSFGPGDSPERTTLLERVKELKKAHADIVGKTATMMALRNANEATNEQLAALLDAVTERIEREAIQDEGTQPEGATP